MASSTRKRWAHATRRGEVPDADVGHLRSTARSHGRVRAWELMVILAVGIAVSYRLPEATAEGRSSCPTPEAPRVIIREVPRPPDEPLPRRKRPIRKRARRQIHREFATPPRPSAVPPGSVTHTPGPESARLPERHHAAVTPPASVRRRVPSRRLVSPGEIPPSGPARGPARHDGESAVALNNRAYRLQRQGRHREAEPLLRRALALAPGYAHAQYNLGWSLVAQGRAREALAPLRRTAALQPNRWEPQQRLAEAYAQLGEREKAAAAYDRARALRAGREPGPRLPDAPPRREAGPPARSAAGESAAALNLRGYSLLRQGRPAEAEPLLRRSLALDPNDAHALYNLGWSLVAQGKAREAIAPLRRTAALQPDRWEPQRRLAQAYEQLGDAERAAAAYQRARSLGYGDTRR
jgi:tetratricopeptide (TPR) repeat protein